MCEKLRDSQAQNGFQITLATYFPTFIILKPLQDVFFLNKHSKIFL